MRVEILIIAIILVAIGIFLFIRGNQMIAEVEAYDVGGLPISEFLKAVDPATREKYDTGQSLVSFGTIFGIVGGILCIAGIAVPDKKEDIPYQRGVVSSGRNCPNCGRQIPMDGDICPYCGKDFRR